MYVYQTGLTNIMNVDRVSICTLSKRSTNLIISNWIDNLSRWKQILLGIVLILVFPIVLVFCLIGFVLISVGGFIGGFFCGPCITSQ